MFAPLASASRAASRARERTRSSLEVASHLAAEGDPEGGVMDEIDHLGPEEAEERLEDEYQPLMEGNQGDTEEERGRGREGGRRDVGEHGHREAGIESDGGHDESLEVKTRALELHLAYIIFFILGACILLAWNSEIVAGVYFGARLQGSKFQYSYSNFVALTFTTGNLAFLAWANVTQHRANLGRRIWGSIVVLIAVVALYIASTRIEEINAYLFFTVLIFCTLILAAAASFLQNAVVALSSKFGPACLQGILSGQGAIGLAVAMIQFVAAYSSFKAEEAGATPASLPLLTPTQFMLSDARLPKRGPIPSEGLRNSAFTFFLAIGIFALVALLSYLLLLRLPLYRLVMRSIDTDGKGDDNAGKRASQQKKQPSLRQVERKVRKFGIAMFLVFGVTLSVFPSITATIQSVNIGPSKGVPLGFRGTLTQPALFSPMVFAVFALGDWIGRVLPQIKAFNFTNWKTLMACAVARFVFIPLFLMCNTIYVKGSPIINSDIAFLTIMLLFSLSNGYISTLIMLATVVEPSLDDNEVDTAATCVAFFLTFGLAFGSFASFPVRAIVCGCNPFL